MPEQPENLILQLLREMRADIARNADRMATKDDIARLDQNIDRIDQKIDILRSDVASDLADVENVSATRSPISAAPSWSITPQQSAMAFCERVRGAAPPRRAAPWHRAA